MRISVARALGLASVVAGLVFAPAARAEEEEPVPRPRPTTPDTRAFRPTVALHLGWQSLFGQADAAIAQGTRSSFGLAPGLQLALPVTREFAVELRGAVGSFKGGTTDCPDCTASTQSFGIGAVYHLVDGLPFDPWFSAGIGYRSTKLLSPSQGNFSYTGIDFLRLTVGSDYYPVKSIGFGPFVEFTAGEYFSRSPAPIDQRTGNLTLQAGLRLVLSPF